MDQTAVRNLEQIQEQDEAPNMPKGLSFALVGIGAACIAFAVMAMGGRKTAPVEKRPDPLGELVANRGSKGTAAGAGTTLASAPAAAIPATQLSAKEVTFPSILSDEARPTTALAAVRPPPRGTASAPPPPTDKLPVVTFAGGTPPVPHEPVIARARDFPDDAPAATRTVEIATPASAPQLPAQNVLEATPIVTRPRDALTKSASESAQLSSPPAAQAPSGHEGGWQLQVSSFKTQAEAEQFADQLRARSHKAYAVEAHVPGRGTWWRVRVGPFSSQHAAQAYRSQFEAKEHVVPFVVQPDKADKH
jgi:cell division septation protein DedD